MIRVSQTKMADTVLQEKDNTFPHGGRVGNSQDNKQSGLESVPQ